MAAQHLDELFDLVDPEGAPLGLTKARGLVHRDGDWHRSLHLWVVFESSPRCVLLQRRSLSKDTNPGRVDVSVAGHLGVGESPHDALREAEEEIGLAVRPEDCVALGVRRSEAVGAGYIDRELQHVFMVQTATAFEALRPHPDEVAGLALAPLDTLRALVTTGRPCKVIERGHTLTRRVLLTRDDLVPTGDGYMARALDTIARRCAGLRDAPWRMGW